MPSQCTARVVYSESKSAPLPSESDGAPPGVAHPQFMAQLLRHRQGVFVLETAALIQGALPILLLTTNH